MTQTLKQLRDMKEIVSAKKVSLSKEIIKELGKRLTPVARSNTRHVNVYTFEYLSNGHKVAGFLIEPKKHEGSLPCIVSNRGGSRNFGIVTPSFFFVKLAKMARWGYIVIGSQYSGNKLSEGKDEEGGADVDDVLNLYPILKKLKHADHKRVGMEGGSRGGMMTYILLTRAKWIKAAISVSGVSNLMRSAKLRPEMKEVFKQLFGGSTKEMKKRSALFWPQKFPKNVPLLLMCGTADWRVSPLDSIELSAKLYEHKVPHRLVVFEGSDHILWEHWFEAMDMKRQWFDRFVKNRERLPDLKPHGK